MGVQLLHGPGVPLHELTQRQLVLLDYSVELRCSHSRSASFVSDPSNEDITRPKAMTDELLARARARPAGKYGTLRGSRASVA
jgi:hypothetical protein